MYLFGPFMQKKKKKGKKWEKSKKPLKHSKSLEKSVRVAG